MSLQLNNILMLAFVGKINHSSGIYCISKAIRHNKVLEGRGIFILMHLLTIRCKGVLYIIFQ
jgi:hypothetical protein